MSREVKHYSKHGPYIERYVPSLGITVNDYIAKTPRPEISNKRSVKEKDLSEVFTVIGTSQ